MPTMEELSYGQEEKPTGVLMAKTYDATLKDLMLLYPQDWVRFISPQTTAPVVVVDADLATVTAASDKILRVDEPEPWFQHIELLSSHVSNYPEQLLWYNVLVRHKYGRKVRSCVILLRRGANTPQLTGEYLEQFPGEPPHLLFRYQVLRLWQMPPELFLNGGLGVLPLAMLSSVSEPQLPSLVQRLEDLVRAEASPEQAKIVGAAAILLSGMRWPMEFVEHLFQGVSFMNILEDSSVYHWILAKGEVKEARNILFRIGRKRFGPPSPTVTTTLEGIKDLNRLEELSERLLDVTSWDELLAEPGAN